LSYVHIPRDAGDFSLIDRRVMLCMLSFPERDLFIRGVRAFTGFSQTGVDYVWPERMFGTSTNNLLENPGWAKKGILSFSNAPLSLLSGAGVLLVLGSVILALLYALARVMFPHDAPRGFTSLVLIVTVHGSISILAIGIVGEYIGQIFEEVKGRPRFMRRALIRDGEPRAASGVTPASAGPLATDNRTYRR
jgi:dolichol-phosphate mannosyltransferase